MAKAKKGAPHVTAPTPMPPPTRRTDAALRPATPLEVIVSRALDQELEWYFAYAQAALNRESVGILPSYAAVRILATEPTDEACRGRALELARTARKCLQALSGSHASVLRSAYTPRRWPRAVERAWGTLSPIVVRLAFAADPWPQRSGHKGLEEASALRLAAQLADDKGVSVAQLRSQAQDLFGRAVVAYSKARSFESAAMGVT
jgi:hypothetical protein